MTNKKGGFYATIASNSHGSKVSFTVSSAAKTTAQNIDAWATTGNMFIPIGSGSSLTGVECSVTYVDNISGLSAGWYFWHAYLIGGSIEDESYESLSSISGIEGDTFTVELFKDSGTWKAKYTDVTTSDTDTFTIPGSPPDQSLKSSAKTQLFLESGDAECSDWSSFTGSSAVSFVGLTYYDSSNDPISFTPTYTELDTHMPSCQSGECLDLDTTYKKVTYQGCS